MPDIALTETRDTQRGQLSKLYPMESEEHVHVPTVFNQ